MDGVPHELPGGRTWATLDHGRGRWHRDVRWNWGAGSGTVDGQTAGVQVGGQWTNGTGSTENALLVEGRLSKISAELEWTYDPQDWLAPWRVQGEGVELRFTPEHLRRAVTDLGVISSRTHQCFGVWSGRVSMGWTGWTWSWTPRTVCTAGPRTSSNAGETVVRCIPRPWV